LAFNKKVVVQFTVLTFAITLVAATGMFVFAHFGIPVVFTDPRVALLFALYALAPAIASYVVLKKHGKISGFKEWIKNVFYAKTSIFNYLFIVLGLALYFIAHIAVAGLTESQPFYMFFVMIPIMLFGGGMEEAGWRYILQTELDKKYGFIPAVIITAIIWYVWHLPLFFMPGTDQAETLHFGMYLVTIFGLTTLFGAIVKIAGKAAVFLSVLLHTMFNVTFNAVSFPQTWTGTITAFAVLIIISAIAMYSHSRKARKDDTL